MLRYQVGDVVVYNGEGVCRVEAVGIPELSGLEEQKEYYTLVPLYHEGTIFIPVDTQVYMRPALSRGEAEALIRKLPSLHPQLCQERNLRLITEHYQALLHSHDILDTAQLIKTIYNRRQCSMERGAKPSQLDERYMKRAEDLLHGELAYALGISKESVPDYITRVIEPPKQ